MILIENLPGLVQVQVVLGGFVPGQFTHPLQIIADHLVIRGGGRRALEAVQLPVRLLLGVGGQLRFLQFELNLVDLPEAVVRFPQFLLQRLDVLPEVKILLGLVHLALDLGLNLFPQFQDFQFPVDEDQNFMQAFLDVNGLQQALLFFLGDVHTARGDIRQDPGVAQLPHQGAQFGGQIGRKFQHLQEHALDVGYQGLGFQVRFVVFGDRRDLGHQVGVLAHPVVDAETVEALEQEAHRAVLGFPHLQNSRGGAHGIEIIGAEAGGLLLPASDHPQDLILEEHLVHQSMGPFLPEDQGHDDPGKKDQVRMRQYGQDPGAGLLLRNLVQNHFVFSNVVSHQLSHLEIISFRALPSPGCACLPAPSGAERPPRYRPDIGPASLGNQRAYECEISAQSSRD